jgi:cholesterol oxidase
MCELCEPDFWFLTSDNVWLRLQRYVPQGADPDRRAAAPVLLLHGGSANHRTFTVADVGLADWLCHVGFDPWLLDWRGSSLVADCDGNADTLKHNSKIYNFNRAAQVDLPAAIAVMRSHGVQGPIAAAGHCMGSAVIAEAVACGCIENDIDRVVLLALGLFYDAAIDSRLKSEERILERLLRDVERIPCIDPRLESEGTLKKPWPSELNNLYEAWPQALRAHDDGSIVKGMCNRITFMYGMPFRHENLTLGIHDSPRFADSTAPPPSLVDHFGGFPLQMYLHAARNLREGQAISFESTRTIVTEDARQRFRRLEQVTLITGELNRLWHRDSIDRMHEWLTRGSTSKMDRIQKHVLPTYAHQDLLWGADAPRDVYPHIAAGLGAIPRAPKPARKYFQSD